MTNIQTLAQIDKVGNSATTEVTEKFIYSVRIECYFKDRSKKLFEFERSFDYQLSLGHAEDYQAECARHMFSQVDRMQLVVTWFKIYLERPGKDYKQLFNSLPTIHYGYHTESCFI